MRVVVVREYIDKHTSEFHKVGEKLTVSEERFAEIQKAGQYLVDISDEVGQQETPAVPDSDGKSDNQEQAEPEKTPSNGGKKSRAKKNESEDN